MQAIQMMLMNSMPPVGACVDGCSASPDDSHAAFGIRLCSWRLYDVGEYKNVAVLKRLCEYITLFGSLAAECATLSCLS